MSCHHLPSIGETDIKTITIEYAWDLGLRVPPRLYEMKNGEDYCKVEFDHLVLTSASQYLIIRIPEVADTPLLSHGSGAGDAQW